MKEFSQSALYKLKKYVIKRGYNSTFSSLIYNIHIKNIYKNKRPSIILKK